MLHGLHISERAATFEGKVNRWISHRGNLDRRLGCWALLCTKGTSISAQAALKEGLPKPMKRFGHCCAWHTYAMPED